VQNYLDAAGRAELGDQADLALRRMARELRGALPNSVRTGGVGGVSQIEFIPTKIGGRYLSTADGAGGPVLDFAGGSLDFTVDGAMPVGVTAIVASADIPTNDDIVVSNFGPDFVGADAYVGNNRMRVRSVAGNTVSLMSNGLTLANQSPDQRFQVVRPPVMFVCDPVARTLTRFWNYGFQAAIPPAGAGLSAVLARNVVSCTFRYDVQQNVHTALIGLTIVLGRPNSDEAITLAHQIHVDNTP
jgi:MSHA biogenesis protein MshO